MILGIERGTKASQMLSEDKALLLARLRALDWILKGSERETFHSVTKKTVKKKSSAKKRTAPVGKCRTLPF